MHPQQPQPWQPQSWQPYAPPAPAKRDVRWLSAIGLVLGLFGLVLALTGWNGFGFLISGLGVVVAFVAVLIDERGRALAASGLAVSLLVFLATGFGVIG